MFSSRARIFPARRRKAWSNTSPPCLRTTAASLARLHDDVMRVLSIKVDAHDEGPTVQMQKRDDRDRRDRDDRPRR